MIKTSPRAYQQAIFETAKEKNTLVVLPTGLGKTLIATLLSVNRLQQVPGSKVLMLAPTKPLVEQHFKTFQEQLPELFAQIEMFTGEITAKERSKLWSRADIIFSTPQCVANDLKKILYTLHDVSLLVIDEAHRCLKNYDYTTVARSYHSQAENPRILGLTASPGSEEEKIRQICTNLGIEAVEVRSREDDDVRQYLQNLEFNKILIDFPKEFAEIRYLLGALYESKVQELKSRSLLFGPANKITLLKLQTYLSTKANSGDGNAMVGMSLCAQAIKISHALELLETQTLAGLNSYLADIVQQAAEKKSRAAQILAKAREFNAARISIAELLAKKMEHPKIEAVKTLVNQVIEEKPAAKIIIFTQFRDTASTLLTTLASDKVKPVMFVGQAKKEKGGLSQREQKQVVQNFKDGLTNVLCATSIGEEGLDIPEVSAVVFYEPIPSAIRKIQRTGRTARHAPGKLFILVTKDTRDEIYHYASAAREKKMYKLIEKVKTDMSSKGKITDFL